MAKFRVVLEYVAYFEATDVFDAIAQGDDYCPPYWQAVSAEKVES